MRAPNQKVHRPHVIVEIFNHVDSGDFRLPDFKFDLNASELLEAAEYIEKIELLAQ